MRRRHRRVRRAGDEQRRAIAFAAGDSFQIAVDAGTVRYSKNDAVFHTSASPTGYAMRAHAVLFDANAAIGGVALGR
jgi:hypothetical protein